MAAQRPDGTADFDMNVLMVRSAHRYRMLLDFVSRFSGLGFDFPPAQAAIRLRFIPCNRLVVGRPGRRHIIDVYIWPGTSRAPSLKASQGYHLATKTADGMSFVAISDVDPDELKQLVEML
jgi:hypothetical protein